MGNPFEPTVIVLEWSLRLGEIFFRGGGILGIESDSGSLRTVVCVDGGSAVFGSFLDLTELRITGLTIGTGS